MATAWYYQVNGRDVGPVPPSALKQLANDGVVSHETPVRRECDATWTTAKHVRGLFPETTPEAAKSLSDILKKTPDDLKPIAADACLVCAERLSAEGNKVQAMLLYKGLSGEDQPKYVRLAATRGLLAAAKKE